MKPKINLFRRRTISKGRFDPILLSIVGLLVLWGGLTIFNASYYISSISENFNLDPLYFVKRQIGWLALSFVAGFVFYKIPYTFWKKITLPMMLYGIITLVAVFFFDSANGSQRWIRWNSITYQSAEFVKLIMIIYVAAWLSKERYQMNQIFSWEKYREHAKKVLLPFLFILGGIGFLIVIEPDLGTALILIATSFIMYITARHDTNHLVDAAIIVVVGLLFVLLAIAVAPYRIARLQTFWHTIQTGEVNNSLGAGYQINKILVGVGSGGLEGVGFGQSRQRFGYLVENTAFTDSIAAVIFEESGFIGAFFLLSLFWILFYRSISYTAFVEDTYAKMLIVGISFWIVIQAVLHFAANLAVIPVTGVPLPFMTYGGSSLLSIFMGTGLLLNVIAYHNVSVATKRKGFFKGR